MEEQEEDIMMIELVKKHAAIAKIAFADERGYTIGEHEAFLVGLRAGENTGYDREFDEKIMIDAYTSADEWIKNIQATVTFGERCSYARGFMCACEKLRE